MATRQRGTFSARTAPYLFCTEYPFTVLDAISLRARDVLTIGGSGDLPLYYAGRDAKSVLAVDISTAALALCQIKNAAVRILPYEDFLWFFLAGIERAAAFLARRGIAATFKPQRWLELYQQLLAAAPQLRAHCWPGLLARHGHPFASLLRPTDLWFLEEIPYLKEPAAFSQMRSRTAVVRLLQADIASFLACSPGQWDFIYLSNVPEYFYTEAILAEPREQARHVQLHLLFTSAVKCLKPGGMLGWYLFHNPDKPDDCFRCATEVLQGQGYCLAAKKITYHGPAGLSLTNGVALAQRAGAP
ncbi:MAG: DUF3419 family protein [Deltaproteobacteria bacterium]|nr:DUF3419 family protein [Deltaproteobacteria bacterium]MBW2071975.1 DUF3419 family protein [Deltaproteobacteria bacterium]